MKNLFKISLVVNLIFFGCDEIPDSIVDNVQSNFQWVEVTIPDTLVYSPNDSSLIVSIKMSDTFNEELFFNVKSTDGKEILADKFPLLDNGDITNNADKIADDKIFTGKTFFSKEFQSRYYYIEIIGKDKYSKTQKLLAKNLFYKNNLYNFAPIISDIQAPDTVIIQSPKSAFVVSIAVNDSNGLSDIAEVYFLTYRPNGTTSGNKFYLYDDGDITNHGDQVANDGRYSLIIEAVPSQTRGIYRFEFKAKDKGGKFSNTLSHNISLL
ncbi:MAG: hypothetical protein JW866_08865 [Ignavibacteriales bacterium]|nr:hypothetical protein [Ignavibacteriales bacterium]